jgi:hypothetical protein
LSRNPGQSLTQPSSRRFAAGLAAVAGAALVIRVVYVAVVVRHHAPVGDAETYVQLATDLAHGRGYIRPYDLLLSGVRTPTAEFPPLWPTVLTVPVWLGLDSPTALRLVGAVVGTATVVVVGLLGRRVATTTVGLVAAGIAAVNPYLVSFDGSLQAESLYALAIATTLLLLAVGMGSPARWRWWVLSGVALGLAVLTRTEALLLLPVVVVPIARSGADGATWAKRVGAVTLAVAVLLGSWTVRNALRLHSFEPLTNNSGTLLAGANCEPVYAGYQIGLWRLDCVTALDVAGLSETAAAGQERTAAVDFARDHGGRLPAVVAARVLRTWGAWSPARQTDFESLEGRPKAWIDAAWVAGWLVLVLAVAGGFVQRRTRRPVWLLAGPVVVATVTAVIGYGNSRFRMVAEPGLTVLAAIGVVAIAAALHRRPVESVA